MPSEREKMLAGQLRIAPIVLATLLSTFPLTLGAQRCLGGVPFSFRRVHLGADASLSAVGRSASGSLSIGSARGPFASIGLGTTHNDEVNDDATLFTASAGAALPFGQPKTQLCPIVSVAVTNGMASNATVILKGHMHHIETISTQAYGLGAAVGTALSSVTAFELVPFASAAVIARNTTFYVSGPIEAIGDHYYAVSLGAGAIVEKVITIRPFMTLTVADGPIRAWYGLHVSFSFGRVTPRRLVGTGEGSLTRVWLNRRVGVYYCPGSASYGATPDGAFMTEREALAGGATPAQGRRC